MANRAGLKKVTKTVRGKKGTVRRSYWVKAGQVAKTVGKVALGAAAVAGAAHLARKGLQRRGLLASKNNTWSGSMAHSSNNTAGTWKGSVAHHEGPTMRAKASMLRSDASKAVGEGRKAAASQYSTSRQEHGFGRVASAYHALRAGHAVGSNSFKGRRALRG